MTTFHPFPRLATELRAQIWEMTVDPHTVEWETVPHLFSSTPVPATLQACREARNQGLYQKEFSEVANQHSTEPRYVWLNLEIDMVSIGTSDFYHFEPVASTIKRLKFERENGDESFYHFQSNKIKNFVNAKEIHVVCADGFWMWSGAMHEHYWPCGHENLFFIDPDDGRVSDSRKKGKFEVRTTPPEIFIRSLRVPTTNNTIYNPFV
ncbi:hypothetical protein EJ02DRAFT_440223 [Clathrospora elynae]|uniref:2EXR domain-containing protein n=1 Tax=Clathrospora elynae TaxID=706981 RepID=A0A6A5TBD1_9PLEO|nr:hypothetical protein EJ02DRAFT_440223 [Clathrospora elynae]